MKISEISVEIELIDLKRGDPTGTQENARTPARERTSFGQERRTVLYQSEEEERER